jgi:hypothetical protein
VSGVVYEPGTSRIRSRNVTHSTTTLDRICLPGQHVFLASFCRERKVFFYWSLPGALGVSCDWCSRFEKSICDSFSRDVGCCSVSALLMNMGRRHCGSSGIRVHQGGYSANSQFNIHLLSRQYTSSKAPLLAPAFLQCTFLTLSHIIYISGSQTFSVHRPLGSIYTHTAPLTFF